MPKNLLDLLYDNVESVNEKSSYTLEDALERALADTTPTRAGVPRRVAMTKGVDIKINEIPYKGEFAEEEK